MSILIDDLLYELKESPAHKEFGGKWYVAKYYDWQICSISTFFLVMKTRILDALEILRGKAVAIHYKEDEV